MRTMLISVALRGGGGGGGGVVEGIYQCSYSYFCKVASFCLRSTFCLFEFNSVFLIS